MSEQSPGKNQSPRRTRPSLVVIGNGMAGMRTVEHLIERAPDLYDITVFGAEPYGNYNRVLLSPVLAGEMSVDDIMLNPERWYAEHGITLRKGETVEAIDRRRREVVTVAGERVAYDRLLIATGSTPIILPVPGIDLPGVCTFRDILDVNGMVEAAATHRKAVVIGGGLLGLEAANGLNKRGMDVTVVHLVDSLIERQLDPPAAALLRETLEARGLKFRMPAQTAAILGEARAEAVRFTEEPDVEADLVVMAVGIRPNIHLARRAGLHCERGIVVTDTMQTYDGAIYAVGECVQHRRSTYGLVAPLFDQAKVCANHLAMKGFAVYPGSAISTRLKVTGVDLFSAGEFSGGEGRDDIVVEDRARGIYKRIVMKGDVIVGAVCVGDAADGNWYFEQIVASAKAPARRDGIAFGVKAAPSSHEAAASDLPHSEELAQADVSKGEGSSNKGVSSSFDTRSSTIPQDEGGEQPHPHVPAAEPDPMFAPYAERCAA